MFDEALLELDLFKNLSGLRLRQTSGTCQIPYKEMQELCRMCVAKRHKRATMDKVCMLFFLLPHTYLRVHSIVYG